MNKIYVVMSSHLQYLVDEVLRLRELLNETESESASLGEAMQISMKNASLNRERSEDYKRNLLKYGFHRYNCEKRDLYPRLEAVCTCGFETMIRAVPR